MYEAGNGVLKDNVLAYQWYSLGAMNGSNSAKKSKEYLETRMTPLEIKDYQLNYRHKEKIYAIKSYQTKQYS